MTAPLSASATRALRLMIVDQCNFHGASLDSLVNRLDGILSPEQVHGQKNINRDQLAEAADRLDTLPSVWLDRAIGKHHSVQPSRLDAPTLAMRLMITDQLQFRGATRGGLLHRLGDILMQGQIFGLENVTLGQFEDAADRLDTLPSFWLNRVEETEAPHIPAQEDAA